MKKRKRERERIRDFFSLAGEGSRSFASLMYRSRLPVPDADKGQKTSSLFPFFHFRFFIFRNSKQKEKSHLAKGYQCDAMSCPS